MSKREPFGHGSALTLEATNLGWLGSDDRADWDQCAHGIVTCAIGTIAVTSRNCNVTAASLFLLRTLEFDHTPSESVAPSNQLLPCCGHSPWVAVDGRFPTINMGCDNGDDLWVRHVSGAVVLAWGELHEQVPSSEWREAVVSFADLVRAFYDASPPRRRARASDADTMENDGWDAFWSEWGERYTRTRPGSVACRPAFIEDSGVSDSSARRLWKACLQAVRPTRSTSSR
jgi:hypothetical protein